MGLTASMADEQRITRVIKGVTLKGTFSVEDGIITVATAIGSKSTQVGRRRLRPGSPLLLRKQTDPSFFFCDA